MTAGTFSWENLASMRAGIECFNQQKYWECHEELEHVWLEERSDPVRYIYWAVIQAAATMVHYRDSKLIGCQGMIKKTQDKVRKCRELHILSDLAFQYLSWQEFESLILSLDPCGPLESFAPLFDFRFQHYPFEQVGE